MWNLRRRDFLKSVAATSAASALPLPAFAAEAAGAVTLKDGRTASAPMLASVAKNPYDVLPLVSAGDNVPLLIGTWPDMSPHAELTYGIAGAPDGMGLMAVGDGYWLWLQHELVGDPEDEDFEVTRFSNTIEGMVPGARISLIKLDKDWKVVGGTSLVRSFHPTTVLMQDDGVTPRVLSGPDIVIDETARTYSQTGYVASDFCGGYLAETGFFNPKTGKQEPVWFASEENGGYSGIVWACFPDGHAYPVEGMGIYEKETTIALRDHRPAEQNLTILVGTEDDDDSELYLWIGMPTAEDPNGITSGQLFAMKVEGAARESGPGAYDGKPANAPSTAADGDSTIGKVGDSKPCTWVSIPREATATYDTLDAFVGAVDDKGARRTTAFLATEDLNEDATVSGRIWVAADGGAGSEAYDDEAPRYENPLSRLYRVDLNIGDPRDPSTWATTITYALEGGAGKGVSYDNLATGSHNQVLLGEDWDQGSDEADAVWDILKAEKRGSALYLYDAATGATEMVLEALQGQLDPNLDWKHLDEIIAAGNEDTARNESAFWETSGMIEVTHENSADRSAWLITIQAHSLKTDGYGEGGQVVLARPKA